MIEPRVYREEETGLKHLLPAIHTPELSGIFVVVVVCLFLCFIVFVVFFGILLKPSLFFIFFYDYFLMI